MLNEWLMYVVKCIQTNEKNIKKKISLWENILIYCVWILCEEDEKKTTLTVLRKNKKREILAEI